MARTLDLTALRTFAAVADMGGVTRAANRLNLTQSAVSMQIKRLEQGLGRSLLDRNGRGVAVNSDGELLLSYAHRMIQLNDEAWRRMTADDFEGEVRIGVPGDIVQPHLPEVLRRFRKEFPRAQISLATSFSVDLLEQLARGDIDLTLTTEAGVGDNGQTLSEAPLCWLGAEGGDAYLRDPLPYSAERHCAFRPPTVAALEAAGRAWTSVMESAAESAQVAAAAADMAVMTQLASHAPPELRRLPAGALPDLPPFRINMYRRSDSAGPLIDALATLMIEAYGD